METAQVNEKCQITYPRKNTPQTLIYTWTNYNVLRAAKSAKQFKKLDYMKNESHENDMTKSETEQKPKQKSNFYPLFQSLLRKNSNVGSLLLFFNHTSWSELVFRAEEGWKLSVLKRRKNVSDLQKNQMDMTAVERLLW